MSSGKKILLIGFIITLLVGIPLTVYLVGQSQVNQSHATASTTLTFSPSSTQQTPLVHNVGDTIPLDINIDPGTNIVPLLTLDIIYDPAALSVDPTTGFQPNKSVFPTYPSGPPTFAPGHITVTLSTIGSQLGLTGITQPSKVGTLSVKALAPTDITQITYSQESAARSTAGPATGSNDSAGENVLLPPLPAFISISGSGSGSLTGTPGATPSANMSPLCTALNVDRAASGSAPFSLTFTAIGNDPDGIIQKAKFNFGDGPTKDVTSGGNLGSKSVDVQIAHTYNNPGTFTTTAVLTDNQGGISSGTSCQQTVTVSAAQRTGGSGLGGTNSSGSATTGGGGGTLAGAPTAVPTPISSLPNTGPGDKFIIAGAVTAILTALGGILFLAL